MSSGSTISLGGDIVDINIAGSGWTGIDIQSTSGSVRYSNVSGAQYDDNVYNGYSGIDHSYIQYCDRGANYTYYAYGDIGPSGVFSGNNWDVRGDYTSTPSPGGSYYGYLSFRDPGYYQIYSEYPGTLYACGNYWGDCGIDPIVTGNISYSNRLCSDPNPLITKQDDDKDIGTISLSKRSGIRDITPVQIKEPGMDKVDNAYQLQMKGKNSEALIEYENIINEYPDNFAGNIALVMMERCLDRLDRKGDILDKLNAVSQKTGKMISLFAESRKGYQYMKNAKYGDAVNQFKLVLNTTQDSTLIKMSMFVLKNLHYKYLNDKPAGEKYYRDLIKLYPYDILSEMSLMALGEWKTKEKENRPVKETKPASSELEVTNYPNPFNPTTKIMFNLPENTRVSISIYNSLGQEIEKILDEQKEKGSYSLEWNPGKKPSGVYYYRIKTDKTSIMNKMVYVK